MLVHGLTLLLLIIMCMLNLVLLSRSQYLELTTQASLRFPSPSRCQCSAVFPPLWNCSLFPVTQGAAATCSLIKRYFCWETIHKDVKEYVAACPVCAHNKSNTQRPASVLQPLTIPHLPSSHISLAFVTGLPVPSDKTTIFTVIDRVLQSSTFHRSGQTPHSHWDSHLDEAGCDSYLPASSAGLPNQTITACSTSEGSLCLESTDQ